MSNSNSSVTAAPPLIATAVDPSDEVKRAKRSAGFLERIAGQILSAVLVALVITLTLVGAATLYGWYKGVHYPEGIVVRSLALGVILFAALTAAIIWECRDKG